jgi:putative flippase GtrA
VLAGAIATELAILCNFALNDSWTFAGHSYRRSWPGRALRYNATAMGGWAVSVATLALLTHLAGMHPMVANLFALVASFAANYTANKRFTFMRRDELFEPASSESV